MLVITFNNQFFLSCFQICPSMTNWSASKLVAIFVREAKNAVASSQWQSKQFEINYKFVWGQGSISGNVWPSEVTHEARDQFWNRGEYAGVEFRFGLRESKLILKFQLLHISMEKLILISGCYENHCENRFSDSRRISSPDMNMGARWSSGADHASWSEGHGFEPR